MIKNDFGHLGCPYYEEKLENGITLILIPRKSKLKSAGIYIGKGNLFNVREANGAKRYKGTAFFAKERIRSPSFKEELASKGIIGNSRIDYSYTYYSLDSLEDVYSGLKRLRDKIVKRDFKEEELEGIKAALLPRLKEEEKKPENICEKKRLKNRYFASPLKDSVLPSESDSISIHASSLKRFVENYYVPKNRVVFASLSEAPSVRIQKLSGLVFPPDLTIWEKKSKIRDESKVVERLGEESFDGRGTYVSYGFKFPIRKDLYEHYGRGLFPKYELMRKNFFVSPHLIAQLNEKQADLLSAHFYQGGEDTYVSLNRRVIDEKPILDFLDLYFSKLDNRIRKDEFNNSKREYKAASRKNLALPNKVISEFARNFPNHIPYTSLVSLVNKENYSGYRRFGEDISSFEKAAFILKGKRFNG